MFIQNIFRYIVGKLIFSIVTRARFSMVYFLERIYLTLTSIFFICYPVSCCINISMQCTINIPFKVRRLFNIYLPLLKNLRHYKCSIFYLHTIFSLLFVRQCISNQQKYRAHLTRRLAGNLFCFVCFPWRFSRCFQIIWHCQQNLEPFSNLLTSIFFKSSLRFCRCCFQSIFFLHFVVNTYSLQIYITNIVLNIVLYFLLKLTKPRRNIWMKLLKLPHEND